MNILRAIIVAGQLGKIWSNSPRSKKVFQSISAVGYFYLMESLSNGTNQVFTLGDTPIRNEQPKIIYKKVIFNKRPW